jgi:hypothetical protein
MNTEGFLRCVSIGFTLMCVLFSPPLFSQDSSQTKVLKQEELDQLLAPIALYPDDLLAQILTASTYPLEVVEAERWIKKNKDLKGDALKSALEKQPWDKSVKSLVPFPDVLAMMSEKLEWTGKLGDAFLAQEKEVMLTVQNLRKKADKEGNLKSSEKLTVQKQDTTIIIQSANPEVIYVPSYNPTVVYGTWPAPAYPPYPVYAYPPGAALLTFTAGVALGAAFYHGWGSCNWNSGSVNVNRNVNINGAGNFNSRRTAVSSERWQHNPEHRRGVAYRDQSTRGRYTPTDRAAVDSRREYRGYGNAAERASGGQGAQRQGNLTSGRAQNRDNALSGMDRGSRVSSESARGRQSISSSRSFGGGGGGGGGGRGGGGRGRR